MSFHTLSQVAYFSENGWHISAGTRGIFQREYSVGYLGLPKIPSVVLAGAVLVGAVSTGSFRRFERICLLLIAGSFVLIPIYLMVHPPIGQMAHNFIVPTFPHGAQVSTVMLLIIGIVGTTVAPWQLFFQQSYVIDKRITPRFINYERADLWIGIGIVVVGAAAMFGFSAAVFAGQPEFGNFTNAGAVAAELGKYVSRFAVHDDGTSPIVSHPLEHGGYQYIPVL